MVYSKCIKRRGEILLLVLVIEVAICGALNDVSSSNIIDLLEMASRGITHFTTKPLQKPKNEK